MSRRYLMCTPEHFAVRYRINPWMQPDVPADAAQAITEWSRLHDTLVDLGHDVVLVKPQPELPDMVFTANGGIVIGDRALVPRFRHRERAGEAEHFERAFRELGIGEVAQARYVNEGEGDFRLVGDILLAGTGFRSEARAADEVADFFGLPVVPLTLVDERLYHLDTALGVLDEHTVVYWPEAFDPVSRALLAELFPDAVLAGADDAARLGINLVSDGSTVVLADSCPALAGRIAERGFAVHPLPYGELRKAGGGPKCCVLELHEQPRVCRSSGAGKQGACFSPGHAAR